MNVNPLIISSLSPLSLPVAPNVYEGTADEYITFNYSDERPAMRADDTDELDETSIQVHLFTRNNPQQAKKDMRRLLRAAGFTIMSTQEFYETDTKYNHIVVEVWIEGIVEDL